MTKKRAISASEYIRMKAFKLDDVKVFEYKRVSTLVPIVGGGVYMVVDYYPTVKD